MSLDERFARGELIHPLEGAPSSVDLFQTMCELAGGRTFEESRNKKALRELIGHHDHYLFVLVDGLGTSLSGCFPASGFLASAATHRLHSVFPSTTAVALTSLATGAWPAEHGLTGWWTYFPEHRRVLCPLLFSERGTGVDGETLGLTMNELVPSPPVMGGLFRTVSSLLPREITSGAYAGWSRGGTSITPYRSFSHARELLARLYRRTAGPTYTYLYLLTVDKACHAHGVASEEVANEVARVDRLLGRIREAIPQRVRMVVSADHGLVDVLPERHFVIRDQDPIARHLIAGQTGEATTPVFHLREGADEAFREEFSRHEASRYFSLHEPEELGRRGFYGPVGLSNAARSHLGDYVGVSTEPALLEYVPTGRSPVDHIGVHGGLRPAEMQVPLILA